jgi:hypothetical protein
MKKLSTFIFTAITTAAITSAHAGVTAVLSGPSVIDAGQTASFTAHVTLTPLDGYDFFAMTGLDYQFDSGDGTFWMGTLASSEFVGGTLKSYDFSAHFLYDTPGTFAPKFTVTSHTTEFQTDYVAVPYFQNSGYSYQTRYSCGVFNTYTCYQDHWVDTSRWIGVGYVPHAEIYNVATSAGSVTSMVVNVPEPQTYAMMLAGLGLMFVIARRRKAK